MGAMGADFGPEHPTLVAIGASRSRLGATRGVDELLRRISLQDNPLRVQGKLMSPVSPGPTIGDAAPPKHEPSLGKHLRQCGPQPPAL